MHTVHQIAVSTPIPIENDDHARNLLLNSALIGWKDRSTLQLIEHNPYWFEGYKIGGNFSPYYKLSNGDKQNFIPLSDSNTFSYLKEAEKRQNKFFLEILEQLNGREVGVAGEDGYIFGLPVAKNDSEANARTSNNKNFKQQWNNLTSVASLEEAKEMLAKGGSAWLTLHETKIMIDLLMGRWIPESMFYAPMFSTSSVENFLMNTNNRDKDSIYLVAVEFSF
jgi:hypothetical protein